MLEENALIINGKSTAHLPFFVAVEEVPGLNAPAKKDRLYNLDHVNGALVQSVDAWEVVIEEFKFYLHRATRSDLRTFKAFIGTSGSYSRYDDADFHRNYLATEIQSSPMDLVGGYLVSVKFTCEPFEYEKEKWIDLSENIENHTSANMYPRIEIKGNSIEQTYLTIGKQTMRFDKLTESIIIECKHGFQNVEDKYGESLNGITIGAFFEVEPGNHRVEFGPGIESVRMLTRWGWR